MAERPERRVKRSLILDPDMIQWIEARAEAASASDSTIVRQLIRAAMAAEDSEQAAPVEGAAA